MVNNKQQLLKQHCEPHIKRRLQIQKEAYTLSIGMHHLVSPQLVVLPVNFIIIPNHHDIGRIN